MYISFPFVCPRSCRSIFIGGPASIHSFESPLCVYNWALHHTVWNRDTMQTKSRRHGSSARLTRTTEPLHLLHENPRAMLALLTATCCADLPWAPAPQSPPPDVSSLRAQLCLICQNVSCPNGNARGRAPTQELQRKNPMPPTQELQRKNPMPPTKVHDKIRLSRVLCFAGAGVARR